MIVKTTCSARVLQNLVAGLVGKLSLLHALELQILFFILLLNP